MSVFLDFKNDDTIETNQTDVNEIIVKMEIAKFQKLLDNRLKHRNNLLKADIKRVYPMNIKLKSNLSVQAFLNDDEVEVGGSLLQSKEHDFSNSTSFIEQQK